MITADNRNKTVLITGHLTDTRGAGHVPHHLIKGGNGGAVVASMNKVPIAQN